MEAHTYTRSERVEELRAANLALLRILREAGEAHRLGYLKRCADMFRLAADKAEEIAAVFEEVQNDENAL